MALTGIDSFEIFDVDIGKNYRRLPTGGWMPTDKARLLINEYSHAPNRIIGTFVVPDGLRRIWEVLGIDLPSDDPFGRRERERMVDISNQEIPRYQFEESYKTDFNRHLGAISELSPKVIYEIVYPARVLGSGKPIYSPAFIQRISLQFEKPEHALGAAITRDPLDRS